MRRIQLASHLSTEELEHRSRRATEATERSWWQILWLLSRGQTAKAVAESTGYSAYWIGRIAGCYNTEGPAGMGNRSRTTARRTPSLLSSAQMEELRAALAGPAPQGGNAGPAGQWRSGWRSGLDGPWPHSAAGTICSGSKPGCASHAPAMWPPARRNGRPLKGGPSLGPRRRRRLPRRHR